LEQLVSEKLVHAQRDFNGGQIDATARRRDDVDDLKSAGRKMLNWRPTAAGSMKQRPGRRALYRAAAQRVEYLRMAPGYEYMISFPANQVVITDLAGNYVFTNTSGSYLWNFATDDQIVWCQARFEIIICFPGMQPQILTWDRSTHAWSVNAFAFTVGANNYLMEPFYRLSVPGARMSYSATSGTIALVCSVPYFAPAMVGARLSILGQQVQITGYTDSQHATAVVANVLPSFVTVTIASANGFEVGQIIETTKSNLKMEISSIGGPYTVGSYVGLTTGYTLNCVMMNSVAFDPFVIYFDPIVGGPVPGATSGTVYIGNDADHVVGPTAVAAILSVPTLASGPQTTVQWSEEFMSPINGWPQGCAYDNERIIFYDFPQMPEAVLWGSLYGPNYFWVDATASSSDPTAGADAGSAILEFLAPSGRSRPRVRHVVGWGDEFVFTDKGIFYVPVSASNPLKPGSVEFREITSDGCADIRPVQTSDCILYMGIGANAVSALIRTGGYSTPYIGIDASGFYAELFTNPICMALTIGAGSFPERYVYVLNADGSVIVGTLTKKQDRVIVGWMPWQGALASSWLSSDSAVIYYISATPSISICEIEDASVYCDMSVPLNAIPANLVIAGKGPAWWAAGKSVTLMDGAYDRGERSVDFNGNIIPAQGEDLTSPTLMIGMMYPAPEFEPFLPDAADGQSMGQRQKRRRITRFTLAYTGSTDMAVRNKTFPAYDFNDDATVAPPSRDRVHHIRPLIRDYEPRISVVKPRPGPCQIVEVTVEVTP
jgi:hypothetical protein